MSCTVETLMSHLRALENLAARQLERPVSSEQARVRIQNRVEECKVAIRKEMEGA